MILNQKHKLMLSKCPLTGIKIEPDSLFRENGDFIIYETPATGKVHITMRAAAAIASLENERYIIAGICRHKHETKEAPVLIDVSFILADYKELEAPEGFDKKVYALLQYIYKNGGQENKAFDFLSSRDFPLAYASPEEFTRVIDRLSQEGYINIRNTDRLAGGIISHRGITLTSTGRKEAEKSLPKMPMADLVNQEITTGDQSLDDKINHAKKLFFERPESVDKMRSACESLSYVLEPLRKELPKYFHKQDVSDFFNIVNNFDIRHNKDHTKKLIHPEQLEWVFYSLLNTISTYVKLKKRLTE